MIVRYLERYAYRGVPTNQRSQRETRLGRMLSCTTDTSSVLSRSRMDPAAHVARAKELLAVADGASFEAAARAAGRRSGDAVAHLVARFNRDGIDALVEQHGGGQPKRYTVTEQERILREVRRTPDREQDKTACQA